MCIVITVKLFIIIFNVEVACRYMYVHVFFNFQWYRWSIVTVILVVVIYAQSTGNLIVEHRPVVSL